MSELIAAAFLALLITWIAAKSDRSDRLEGFRSSLIPKEKKQSAEMIGS